MSAAATVAIAAGIAIICTDPSVTPGELAAYCDAQTKQLAEFAADWSRLPIAVAYFADKAAVPKGMPTVLIAPTCDDPEALAYHTEGVNGEITGLVGVDTCKSAGVSWQSAASHECLEAAVDPYVNDWVGMPDGKRLVAKEVCDPVQDQTYKIDGVELSSYVRPAWFDDSARGESFDRLDALKAPFTRTAGGYFVVMVEGRTSQVGARGSFKPKAALARGARRTAAGAAPRPLNEVSAADMLATAQAMGSSVAAVVNDVAQRARRAAP